MKIIKNKLILFILINLFFCQGEYQIITSPKNLFQLSSNGGLTSSINSGNYNNPGSLDIINDNYSFSLIRYPANIMMYNFSINKYSISYLDYGIFEDKLHDIVNQRFSAHEVMIQYNHNSKIRNNTIGFSIVIFIYIMHLAFLDQLVLTVFIN